MNHKIQDVILLCSEVSKVTQIEAAVRNSYKGATIASGGAFVGGILGGPPGIFVGGALGGAVGWWMSEEFQPLPQFIMKMTSQEKEKLYSDVMTELGNLEWVEVAELISKVMGNYSKKMQVCAVIITFAKNNLGLKVRHVG